MLRGLLLLILLGFAAASSADGPGSRILAGPPAPQPASPAAERDLQRCDAMHGDAKQRCIRELRGAIGSPDRPPHQGPGPEATGMGSGAGTGATSAKK
jgi:hypothetical protein